MSRPTVIAPSQNITEQITAMRASRETTAAPAKAPSGPGNPTESCVSACKALASAQSERPANTIRIILIQNAGVPSKSKPRKAEKPVKRRRRKVPRISQNAGAVHEENAHHYGHADGMKA